MRNISKILDQIKILKGFKKDWELAKFFGVAPNTISTWRKRGTIDYNKLITICDQEGWFIDKILTGECFDPKKAERYAAHQQDAGHVAEPKAEYLGQKEPLDNFLEAYRVLITDFTGRFVEIERKLKKIEEKLQKQEKTQKQGENKTPSLEASSGKSEA